jgi:NTP pyrophosphatase (non-canonical NTP hydrolase)
MAIMTSAIAEFADATTPVAAMKEAIRLFAAARQWEPFHSPKNLAMALASEVGELCDVFRWLTEAESRAASGDVVLREAIADEMADAANILFLLSVHTGIDLSDAVARKLAKNAIKYPAPSSGPDM